jgi:hypothetical protein
VATVRQARSRFDLLSLFANYIDFQEWSTEQEKCFRKALSALKSKDPKIYDDQQRFFRESTDANTSTQTADGKKKKQSKEKPMFLKDYERKLVMDHGGYYCFVDITACFTEQTFSDISDEDNESGDDGPGPSMAPGYYEQQNAIKNESVEHCMS